MRDGHTVAKGRGATLRAASRLPRGKYTLVVSASKAATRIAVVVD